MGHNPDNRIASQEKLQMYCNRLYNKADHRVGDIYLCAQESARQALINMKFAYGDVTRVVNS